MNFFKNESIQNYILISVLSLLLALIVLSPIYCDTFGHVKSTVPNGYIGYSDGKILQPRQSADNLRLLNCSPHLIIKKISDSRYFKAAYVLVSYNAKCSNQANYIFFNYDSKNIIVRDIFEKEAWYYINGTIKSNLILSYIDTPPELIELNINKEIKDKINIISSFSLDIISIEVMVINNNDELADSRIHFMNKFSEIVNKNN